MIKQDPAVLREAAARYERDAAAEFPGSYYRKAFRAKARRLRRRAAELETKTKEEKTG